MVGAFLHTFFEGLDIKCSLVAYALLNDRDGGLWNGEEAIVGEADRARLGGGDGCISGAADACGLSDGERQTG